MKLVAVTAAATCAFAGIASKAAQATVVAPPLLAVVAAVLVS